MILIMCLGLLLYLAYEKRSETKQIEAISKIEGITYEQISELIKAIKE